MRSDKPDRFNSANLFVVDGMSLNVINDISELLLKERHWSKEEKRKMHRAINTVLELIEPMTVWLDRSMPMLQRMEAERGEKSVPKK